MIERVAIFSKDTGARTLAGIDRLTNEFCSRGIKMQIFDHSASFGSSPCSLNIEKFSNLSDLSGLPDLVLSVGGDGTFLETMLKVKDLGIPVAGVNTGRLGFLANISGEEIKQSVDKLCNGDFRLIERSLLEVDLPSSLFNGLEAVALNQITIQKSNLSMITINVYVDDIYLNTYWADGLIVSTATGSTAYNLSAGGPILSPEDENIIISPISPHNLTIRPIIVTGQSRLRMVVEGRGEEYLATCDFRSTRLPFSREIKIVQSQIKLKSVMLSGTDFFSTIRNKLMWGVDKRN
jgi:NAD+ kinase